MSDDLLFIVRLSAALGSGLMAGLFFAFSVAVMRGFRRVPAPAGMAAMQAINVAIINPVFLPVFLGTALLCGVVLVSSLLDRQQPGAAWFIAGAAAYLVGAFLVTIAGNVPMNNRLALASPDGPESALLWAWYQSRWTAWNHVRTIASLAAAAALTLALVR